MINVTDKQFEEIVAKGIDAVPKLYLEKLNNVAIVVEDEPTEEQKKKLGLCQGQTLFGLYEGVPLTKRGGNYSLILPDKITIFKKPLEASSNTIAELTEQVKHTVWHEVAHYYGLDHEKIHELETPV